MFEFVNFNHLEFDLSNHYFSIDDREEIIVSGITAEIETAVVNCKGTLDLSSLLHRLAQVRPELFADRFFPSLINSRDDEMWVRSLMQTLNHHIFLPVNQFVQLSVDRIAPTDGVKPYYQRGDILKVALMELVHEIPLYLADLQIVKRLGAALEASPQKDFWYRFANIGLIPPDSLDKAFHQPLSEKNRCRYAIEEAELRLAAFEIALSRVMPAGSTFLKLIRSPLREQLQRHNGLPFSGDQIEPLEIVAFHLVAIINGYAEFFTTATEPEMMNAVGDILYSSLICSQAVVTMKASDPASFAMHILRNCIDDFFRENNGTANTQQFIEWFWGVNADYILNISERDELIASYKNKKK